jgi:hypothetical protein
MSTSGMMRLISPIPFKKVSMKTIQILIINLSFFILTACGDGSDGSGQTALKGSFIDSAVEGVTYITFQHSGTTDSAGTFTYLPGQIVSFYIGDILIGSAEGAAMLTPLDFVPGAVDETDPEVTNILRFVQSLDEDSDPDNGITISAATATAAIGQSFDFSLATVDFEIAANALLAVLAPDNTLVDASDAQAHFTGSTGGGSTAGVLTLSGADTGLFGTTFTPDPTLTSVLSLGPGVGIIQWHQDFLNSSFLDVAVSYSGGVLTDVLFTWQDGLSSAAYGISCAPGGTYTLGDCTQMTFDLTGQQVTFDVSVVVESFLNIYGTAPIMLDGILDFTTTVPPPNPMGTLSLAGTDTSLFGTAFTPDPTVTSVLPLGAGAGIIQWHQDPPNSSFLDVAVSYSGSVLTDVLFTWQDGQSSAAYGISCAPGGTYTIGDCTQMTLDLTGQQVTFDVSIVVEPLFNINGTAPIALDGILDF